MEPEADRLGADADRFYELLTKAHEGLSDIDSARLNARLVLILANRIGAIGELETALAAARKGIDAGRD